MEPITSSYADIKTREDANAFVEAMLNTNLGREYPELLANSLRQDAHEEWKKADGSPLPDAGDRAHGASLVLLSLNIREGVQL